MTNQGAAGHSIRRAKVILWEAEMLSEAGHWSLTVRRVQESVEFALKGALVWAGIDVPKMHDVGPLLRQHAERFPAEFSSAIPTLASTSRALRAEREISFYGDPESGIPPEDLYGEGDALEALQRARFVVERCEVLLSTEVTIRPLIMQDIEKFVAWRGGDDYKDDIVRKEIQEHLAGKRVLFVAETGGQLLGTVQFVPTHEDTDLADGRTRAYLQALEVREDFRRQGLGKRLTDTVERIGIEQGFRCLTLMVEPGNKPAISFYRKRGFEAFKDSSELWRGKPLAVMCMSKALA